MWMQTEKHGFAGQVYDRERGFRTVVGAAAIITTLVGTFPEISQMFTAMVLGVYMIMTAIIGHDPFYAISEMMSQRSGGVNNAKVRANALHRPRVTPVKVQQYGRS